MNAHETSILRTFKFCTLQKALQLKHNVVIVTSWNHPTVGKTQDDPLSSPELSLIPKVTPSLTHLDP